MNKNLIKTLYISPNNHEAMVFGVPTDCDYIIHECGKFKGYILVEEKFVKTIFEASDIYPHIIIYDDSESINLLGEQVKNHIFDDYKLAQK